MGPIDWLTLAVGLIVVAVVIGLVVSGSMHLLARRSLRRGPQSEDVAESVRKAERDQHHQRWGT